MSKSSIVRLVSTVVIAVAFVALPEPAQAFEDEYGCESGGPGATTCSMESVAGNSCSVTCATGFWACCKSASQCQCMAAT